MSYYDYDLVDPNTTVGASVNGTLVWMIISLVLAVIGGITLYFTVFSKKNEGKYKGFMSKLYDVITFKYFFIDDLFKLVYLISVIAISLLSFTYIGSNFLSFIMILVFGNIGLRLLFELLMMFTEMCCNVREINKKIKK